MANTIEELEVIIDLNAWKFNEEIKGVRKELTGLNSTTSKVSNSIGGSMTGSVFKGAFAAQVLLGVVRKVGSAIGNMSKQVMNGGTQLSRLKVATNTVTKNMGIAADEVNNMRKNLADANTYGVKAEQVLNSLAISGLWEMSKGLEAVDARSGETQKGVNALVLTMKDLAAVAGISSSEGIERLSQFITRANTSSLQGMFAVGDLGIEYREFAQTLNKTGNELSAEEQAFVRMNIVMREGKKAFGAYAESYNTAGKMMGSIKDATSSIFEELGSSLEPIFASVSSAILNFVSGVRNWLLDNAEKIRAWAVKVAGWVVWLVRTIGAVLSKIPVLGGYFQKLANFEVKTGSTAKGTTEQLKKQAGASDKLAGSTKKLNKELAGLAGFDEMNVLKQQDETSGGGGSGVSGVGEAEIGGGMFEGIGDAITSFGEGIGDKFGKILEKVKEFFKPMVDLWNKWVKPSFDGLIAQIKELWASITDSPIGEILKTIAQVIGIIIVGAIVILINVITGLVTIFKWHIEMFKKGFEDLVSFITFLIIAFRSIPDVVKEIVAKVIEWFGILKENMILIWNGIKLAISNSLTSVKNFFSDTWKWISDGAKGAWEGIKNAFSSVSTWFRDVFSKAWEGVKNVFSVGGKIFDGIKDGIGSAFKSVVNTLIGGINTIVSVPFNAINNMIRKLKEINIMGLQPFKNFSTFTVPQIPRLASGGVVESPTMAILGEAGREAIIPLENNTQWIDELASKIGNRGGNMNLVVKIGEDTIYEKTIDYINDKSLRMGSTILNI